MTRRNLFKLLCQLGIVATPLSAKILRAMEYKDVEVDEAKFVLIYDSKTPSSNYEQLIDKAAPFLSARDVNWRSKLVFWDIQRDGNRVKDFTNRYARNTDSFQWPVLVAVPEANAPEPEVETWTLDWLNYANESRFIDGCYPISGGWWSVEGDWNPTIKKVKDHCFKSANHAGGKFQIEWLDTLKFEELQSLHSDHHREMTKSGKVYWKNVNQECPKADLGFF